MQTPQGRKISRQSHMVYHKPVQEAKSYDWTPVQNGDNRSCSDDGSQGTHVSGQSSYDYESCNVTESSLPKTGYPVYNSPSTQKCGYPVYNSPSTTSFPPKTSPESPISTSCLADEADEDLKYKIRELETAMLGTNADMFDLYEISKQGQSHEMPTEAEKYGDVIESISQWDLKEVLIACAKSVSENDLVAAEIYMTALQQMVSVSGEPIQRLGAYMLEGLIARFASSGSSIYKALRCKEPAGPELLSYMHLLYEICPYFKFGYMSANGAIAEAMKNENSIHIIDFQIAQGSQWLTLIQALAARPGGPPRIRITGIDDTASAHARGGGLDIVGKRLSMLANSCKVHFEFHGIALSGSQIELKHFHLQPGEAIGVNFALMLHHMPDESVCIQNHRDRLLRLVKSLSPKVVTLVEQESHTNTNLFLPRFIEAMDYYTAIFESIDVTLPRDHKERMNVEQHCLARDIVNIIACEGAERVERHELLGKWKSRFLMAGFTPYPLSSIVNTTIKALLDNYSDKYGLEERDGALYLGWMNRALVASCAWR